VSELLKDIRHCNGLRRLDEIKKSFEPSTLLESLERKIEGWMNIDTTNYKEPIWHYLKTESALQEIINIRLRKIKKKHC